MIDYVCGRVVGRSPSAVVVDVGGIGYLVQVPLSTLGSVKEGQDAKLFTYLHLRENEVRLFGFATIEERELFCRLLEVNKVGPAIAMSTLSALGVDEFYRLLQRGEPKAL